jgi:4-hydroxybenzoate polyprenyltransferase|tara:strand:+ start:2811 stop:3668 length:858 start_codon:yes stop_codon:yes gene_type:complete
MLKSYLSLVKFSHTIFALPFALVGFTLAISQDEYSFGWDKLCFVLLCMIFARSAAMAFNRYIDRDVDSANPRTAEVREIPNGTIKAKSALLFVIINAGLFIGSSYMLNTLCFYLSPIALLVILGYSYTKRFTALCHLVLGLGLSLSPIGAYLAVTASFDLLPILFSCIVLFWVGGFDIIYALQDESFDKKFNLHSIPVLLGTKNALLFARFLHVLTASILVYIAFNYFHNSILFYVAVFVFISLLLNQHRLVKAHDLSKINLAFFTNNGIASVIFGTLTILELLF